MCVFACCVGFCFLGTWQQIVAGNSVSEKPPSCVGSATLDLKRLRRIKMDGNAGERRARARGGRPTRVSCDAASTPRCRRRSAIASTSYCMGQTDGQTDCVQQSDELLVGVVKQIRLRARSSAASAGDDSSSHGVDVARRRSSRGSLWTTAGRFKNATKFLVRGLLGRPPSSCSDLMKP